MSVNTLWCTFLLIFNAGAYLFHGLPMTRTREYQPPTRLQLHASSAQVSETVNRVDVVLFGVGDLRTDDHGGLTAAMESAAAENGSILPVVILDTKDTMPNIPGAVAHTLDTAAILSWALESLKENLAEVGLPLHVEVGSSGVCDALERVIDQVSAKTPPSTEIHVHVCDLGDVDNKLGYGPWVHCQDGMSNVQLHPWQCRLRFTERIPSSYPEYRKKYASEPIHPLVKPDSSIGVTSLQLESPPIPSSDFIANLLLQSMQLDPDTCQSEKSTGLFGTHWGGLAPETIGEAEVLRCIKSFVRDCNEDDELWIDHPDYCGKSCTRNPASLEHAAIAWMMKGEGKRASPNTRNLIAGESMTRFLAAPLLLGTVSTRRLWHASSKDSPLHESVLKTLSEGREWHNLLASHNLRSNSQFSKMNNQGIQYGYWRWHGFLCRYAKSMLKPHGTSKEKEGILLVHGFGAACSQWTKALDELSQTIPADKYTESAVEGLAPCLIGFGQSEKPPLTYTAYLWDSYVTAFVKEIAVGRHDWDQFVIGGNSIGGFVSMSCGADDTVKATDSYFVSGSGAPGSGRCTGVVLMNSAGQIKTRKDSEQVKQSGKVKESMTVAEITATDGLPACKPIPRPVARLFGNGLLAYLRPRIQSICSNLYPTNPGAVDDALCQGILRDSEDPGAINVMISGSKLPPPRTANELLGADFGSGGTNGGAVREGVWRGPVLVAQGLLDPLNDAEGRASMFQSLRKGITISPINAGHCPHDELPQDVAMSITSWLKVTRMKQTNVQTTTATERLSSP